MKITYFGELRMQKLTMSENLLFYLLYQERYPLIKILNQPVILHQYRSKKPSPRHRRIIPLQLDVRHVVHKSIISPNTPLVITIISSYCTSVATSSPEQQFDAKPHHNSQLYKQSFLSLSIISTQNSCREAAHNAILLLIRILCTHSLTQTHSRPFGRLCTEKQGWQKRYYASSSI